jgi:predicted nucleic acid-binding protein
LVTCEEILLELEAKLRSKFGYSFDRAETVRREVEVMARIVVPQGTVKGAVPDPDDDVVLECAVLGEATHIVTGDRRHLLPLGSYQGIAIVSPASFLRVVSATQTEKPQR